MSVCAPPSALLSVPGKLYAVGGYDGASRQCLSTVEQYNPATNEWIYVADMSTRRSGAGMGSLKGAGFVCFLHSCVLQQKTLHLLYLPFLLLCVIPLAPLQLDTAL